MHDHWSAELTDIRNTLEVEDALALPTNDSGLVTHDIHQLR